MTATPPRFLGKLGDAYFPELKYNPLGSAVMNPEPVNDNIDHLVMQARCGETVLVQLEPGDATVYYLLIVPAWGDGTRENLGQFGIPAEHADEYLIVTYLKQDGGQTFYATDRIGVYDLEMLPNTWTRTVFAWWLHGFFKLVNNS